MTASATGVAVRLMEAHEAAAVGELTVAAYRALDPELLSDGYAAELLDAATRGAEAVVLVATIDGALAGAVTYVPDHTNRYAEGLDDGECAIRMLAVDPAIQRSGAGGALVDECIARAREAGRAQLVLHSTAAMTTAHGIYERRGFTRTPSRDIPIPGLVLMAFTLPLPERSEAPRVV